VSYGIATGVVRPTGQVSFLYSKEEASELLRYMKQQREGGTAAYRRAVRPDIYLYRISGVTAEGEEASFYGCNNGQAPRS